ncbi:MULTISPECIES: phospholipase D family protein [unclassified Streptomyces]|uniref:phospholipase D family protein n=1 Tax=unclassified Streptomyces TaxID=2593676 RepID=UPI00363809B7
MNAKDKYRHWYDAGAGMQPVTENNQVSFFITGEEAFEDIGDRLEYEAGKDAEAYFLGWSYDHKLPMRPNPPTPGLANLSQLLSHFDAKGGVVRAMLWDNSIMTGGAGTPDAVKFINGLSHGKAILDRRTPLAGAHHQKIQAFVTGPDAEEPRASLAYCGGMDLWGDRIGPQGLHDVHCKIFGDGANELIKVFVERWNDHQDHGADLKPAYRSLGPDNGGDLVQVCRTYPRFESSYLYSLLLNRFAAPINQALATGGGPRSGDMTVNRTTRFYRFYDPSQGVQQIGRAVRKAITEAKKFIYLEDQYLVHKWVGQELAKKLANSGTDFRLVILVLHPDAADIEQVWPRRREVLAPLQAVDPTQKRWRVLHRRLDRPHSYVHSKTWIFDDELVITGSANADRRGYTYNSEADVVVAGDLTGARRSAFGATTVAQDLRCRLFAKHLGGRPAAYLNPKQALARWLGPYSQTNVAVFDPKAKRGNPDKYVEALEAAGKELTPEGKAATGALNLMGLSGGADNWLWDYVEDPDSNVPNP